MGIYFSVRAYAQMKAEEEEEEEEERRVAAAKKIQTWFRWLVQRRDAMRERRAWESAVAKAIGKK